MSTSRSHLGSHVFAAREICAKHGEAIPPLLSGSSTVNVASDLGRFLNLAGGYQGIHGYDFSEVFAVLATWWQKVWKPILAASEGMGVYPIALNLKPYMLGELELVAEHTNTFFLVGSGQPGNAEFRDVRLIGRPSPIDVITLRSVLAKGHAGCTAAQLCREHPSERTSATGWSNRLARLHDMRLICDEKSGRQIIYRPILPFTLE